MIEKSDADLFRRRLMALQRARLGARRWWPRYLFHFADLSNVASILKNEELLSRGAVRSRYADFVDSASPDIIDQTDERWINYVRFYFRPKTPTLYRNEGFRPKERRALGGAHCPAPVYLLFDLESIICRADSLFSYGSLARPDVAIYSTGAEFEQLPFDLVYHDSRFEKGERDDIIFHRHAEVIVPESIDLESLRWIWCRSAAEFETLRHLLPADMWKKWRDKIGVRTDYNLFNREWVYVDHTTLSQARIIFYLNPARNLLDTGPMDLRVEVVETATGKHYEVRQKDAEIGTRLNVDLSNVTQPDDYTVRLLIDENIAYMGRYQAENLPY
jgi:hypothetical protein